MALLLAACVLQPAAAKPPASKTPPPVLRIVQLSDGLRSIAPKRDMLKLPSTKEHKLAKAVGLELLAPDHHIVAHRFTGDRLFYIFFKSVDDVVGPKLWILQRIKKVVREWATPDSEPKETTTYQVEVFKVKAGRQKRPDRHHGSFGLRTWHRREIVKHYEIGYAEIPGVVEGDAWPLDDKILFKYLYRYGPEAKMYDAVRFGASQKWSLRVMLCKDGTYAVTCPQLGFDLPSKPATRAAGMPAPNPRSRQLVLTPGKGLPGATVGTPLPTPWLASLGKLLGSHVVAGATRHHTDLDVTLTTNENLLTHITTRAGFAGRTAEGIGLGAHRGEVMSTYGRPADQHASAQRWRYPGVQFDFDTFDCVRRITVQAK